MPTETKSCDRLFAENSISNDAFLSFPNHIIDFRATNFIIIIDPPFVAIGNFIEWSWDGTRVHGKILCEDHLIAFDWMDGSKKIWFRVPAGRTINYRLFLWVRQR